LLACGPVQSASSPVFFPGDSTSASIRLLGLLPASTPWAVLVDGQHPLTGVTFVSVRLLFLLVGFHCLIMKDQQLKNHTIKKIMYLTQ
jgi:hypothetical protein